MRTIFAVVLLPLILALLMTSCAGIDVNGYHARPAKLGGKISCKGACP